MRRSFLLLACLLISTTGRAEFLYERAGGAAIYDWHQDITWLQDANYVQTSGYDPDGRLPFAQTLTFIDYLNATSHLGITTWRLPRMAPITNDGIGTFGYCFTDRGHNVDPYSGELAFMFHETLGLNSKFLPCTNIPQSPHGVTYSGPFSNINNNEKEAYWYEDVHVDGNKTWVVHFEYGGQHADGHGGAGAVWPVFSGDLLFQPGDTLPEDSMLDVKPNSAENELNPASGGTVLVALFGSETFQADDVDLSTVRFGPNRALTTGEFWIQNRNNDGYFDMSVKFNMQDTGITCGDTDVGIYGETYGGTTFTGNDFIVTTSCDTASCHP